VELGEGIQASCDLAKAAQTSASAQGASASGKADLSSLGSMLQARWKSGGPVVSSKPEEVRAGEIRKFRIAKLDAAAKKIELELA
jgi:small subunit ribosomal protein S1